MINVFFYGTAELYRLLDCKDMIVRKNLFNQLNESNQHIIDDIHSLNNRLTELFKLCKNY